MKAPMIGVSTVILVVTVGFVLPVPHGAIPLGSFANGVVPTTYPKVGWGKSMAFVGNSVILPFEYQQTEDTWEYANGAWSVQYLKPSPRGVTWACFVNDPAASAAVYFGGGVGEKHGLGGIGFAYGASKFTWLFKNGAWSDISKTAGPIPALKYPACAYDPSFDGGAVILFGGAYSSYEKDGTWLMNDTNATWAFVQNPVSGESSWVKLDPTRSPSARFGSAMAYDAATGQLILYGGAQNGTSTANGSCSAQVCPHYHDTWELTGGPSSNSWVELSSGSSGAPPGSVLTDMAYDPADGYIIDFGGQDNGYKSVNATHNATWAFGASGWQNITPTHSPPARFGAAMTFDPVTGSVLMIGGLSGTVNSPPLYDFWEFMNGQWTELATGKGGSSPHGMPIVNGLMFVPSGTLLSVLDELRRS